MLWQELIGACPATMILENAETGEVNAIIDGTYLTRFRTGALSGAATEILSRKDSKVFCLIGTGGQAECQLEAIDGADIITAVTVSNEPVFDGKKVKKGCHINAVGSYTPEMSEIDEYIVCNADRIIVDTMEGTIKETGDFIKPMLKGLFNKEKISGELGDLIAGKCSGRKSDSELTLFETTGSAVFDLVTGQKIYEMANKKHMGQIIEY